MRLAKIVVLLALALVFLAFSWASYVLLRVEITGRRDDTHRADAIIVLGADRDHGWPLPTFGARLDHALDLYEEGMAPLVIVVGGKPDREQYTEADAGVVYLREQGMSPEKLVGIGQGDNTYATLRETRALAAQEGLGPVLLVSDRFHMFRSLEMAEDLGLEAYGSPTTTSPIENDPVSRSYYTLREVAAYTAYVLSSSANRLDEEVTQLLRLANEE